MATPLLRSDARAQECGNSLSPKYGTDSTDGLNSLHGSHVRMGGSTSVLLTPGWERGTLYLIYTRARLAPLPARGRRFFAFYLEVKMKTRLGKKFNLRLDEETFVELLRVARAADRSCGYVLRYALREILPKFANQKAVELLSLPARAEPQAVGVTS